MTKLLFDWHEAKNVENQEKHGVSFEEAQLAFLDPRRVIHRDSTHSTSEEERFFCFGRIGANILTVRFTVRGDTIRIFGAGWWRKGKSIYEQTNRGVHRRRDR